MLPHVRAFTYHYSLYYHFLKKLEQGNQLTKTVPDDAANHGFLVLGEFQQAPHKGLAHLCLLFSQTCSSV